MLLLGGTFLPLAHLKIWGIPLFIASLLLITVGLLPHRRLSKLAINPDTLDVVDNALIFSKKKKQILRIPTQSIASLDFQEKEQLYGISIRLKHPIPEKIEQLTPSFDLEAFVVHSRTLCEGADLFLPYFSKRTCSELNSVLDILPFKE